MKIYNHDGTKVLYIPPEITKPIQTVIYYDKFGSVRKITLRINGELYLSRHVPASDLEKELKTLQRSIDDLLLKIEDRYMHFKVRIRENGKFSYKEER